ncbi:MAG: hypothetical protein JW731_00565 [Bacteroidales bacterium]|nr:hypothetical protein [Bacteroidales bacterium]
MKKLNFIFILGFISLFIYSTEISAQIHSSTGGGSWSDTLTWVNWKIPGPNDDVVVEGPVDVTGAECRNLVVQPNGILQNRSYTNYTLRVNGTVTNNGIIRNYPGWYNLYMTVSGDVINNGEWSNSYTYLNGDVDQTLSFSKEFSGYRLEDANPQSALIANTDLTFKNTKIDLNGSQLRLGQGGKLYIYGEWIFNGQIGGASSEVHLFDNAFLERVTLDNVALKGVINVYSSVVLEEESVIELD